MNTMEHNIKVEKTDRLLIIAPHPDDESIGCGGLLSIYGAQCDVLFVTDGRKGYSEKYQVAERELISIREEEAIKATNLARIRSAFFLRIKDQDAFSHKHDMLGFQMGEYKYIFVPNRFDLHLDHRVMYRFVKRALKLQHAKGSIIEYEVGTPLLFCPLVLDISAVKDNKAQMIRMYASQMEQVDFLSSSLALNRYRGIAANCEYAEAYCPADYNNILRFIWFCRPIWAYKLMKYIRR